MKIKDIEKMPVKDLIEYAKILENRQAKLTEREKIEGYYSLSVALVKKMIQDVLNQMKMSQKELAKKTGLSTSSISAYKTGVAIPSSPAMLMIFLVLTSNGELKDYKFLDI